MIFYLIVTSFKSRKTLCEKITLRTQGYTSSGTPARLCWCSNYSDRAWLTRGGNGSVSPCMCAKSRINVSTVWLVTMTRQLAWYHRSAGVHEAAAGGPRHEPGPSTLGSHAYIRPSLPFPLSPISLCFSFFLSLFLFRDSLIKFEIQTPYEVTWQTVSLLTLISIFSIILLFRFFSLARLK